MADAGSGSERERRIRAELRKRFLSVARERVAAISQMSLDLEKGERDPQLIENLQREIHTLKGEARLVGFLELNSVVHQVEDVVATIVSETGDHVERFDLVMAGIDVVSELIDSPDQENPIAREFLARSTAEVLPAPGPRPPSGLPPKTGVPSPAPAGNVTTRDGDSTSGTPPRPERGPSDSVAVHAPGRISSEDVDRISQLVAELGQLRSQRDETLRVMRAFVHTLRSDTERSQLLSRVSPPEKERAAAPGTVSTASLRRLQHWIRRLEEMEAESLHRHEALEEVLKGVRMVTLESFLAGYPRAVRAMAREIGKEVEVGVTGAAFGVDRAVLGAIADPLIHILRNSVDHGMELPEERSRAGKDVKGRLAIHAEKAGSRIVVTVADDGRGIDLDAVRARAVEAGLLSEEAAAGATRSALFELLFAPGFTTSRSVSALSGRGVGMDVVKRRIEAIGGDVELESERSQGTRIRLRIPASLVATTALIVGEGASLFGIPSRAVARVTRLRRDDLRPAAVGPVFYLEEEMVPVAPLAPLVGIPLGVREEGILVVVVEHRQRKLGLIVDRVIGVRSLLHHEFDPFLGGIELVGGTAVLGEGSIVLMIDDAALFRVSRLPHREREPGSATGTIDPLVLVVEDSHITRALLVELLRGVGCRVIEAENGLEALQKSSAAKVRLILLDLDMPVMNGFEFLTEMQKSGGPPAPCVVFSSRDSDEDRRRCLDLGAADYLVKSQFSEADMLSRIGRFLGSLG